MNNMTQLQLQCIIVQCSTVQSLYHPGELCRRRVTTPDYPTEEARVGRRGGVRHPTVWRQWVLYRTVYSTFHSIVHRTVKDKFIVQPIAHIRVLSTVLLVRLQDSV